jgi:hypothetical protein
MAKKMYTVKKSEGLPSKPKRLSKAGEWRRAHPNGLDVIYVDMRAILR